MSIFACLIGVGLFGLVRLIMRATQPTQDEHARDKFI
jgi:hypothetical protein